MYMVRDIVNNIIKLHKLSPFATSQESKEKTFPNKQAMARVWANIQEDSYTLTTQSFADVWD